MGVRLAGPPANVPEHWLMCKTARSFRAAVADDGALGDGYLHTRRLVERPDGSSVEGEWYDCCPRCLCSLLLTGIFSLLGELTDTGRNVRRIYRISYDVLDVPDTMPSVYLQLRSGPTTLICAKVRYVLLMVWMLFECVTRLGFLPDTLEQQGETYFRCV